MRCTHCGSENPEEMNYCMECAAPLKHRCPHCGFESPPQAKFCGKCATPLTRQSGIQSSESGVQERPASSVQRLESKPIAYTPTHLAEQIRAEQAAMEARGVTEGERKTITALFADIKDSTALIEDLDPEEARRLVDPALQLMMDAVHRYEGYVAQSLGDGIFALFGAPIAHEDHPQRALYAALHMQEESKRYAEQLLREHGINLQIRVGLNTGEVVVRSIRKDDLHTDYVPVGHSTNIASRMEGLASGGAIVVSEHTYKLTEGYFQFKALGAARIKGVSEPLNVYEVLGVGPLRTRLQVAARRGLARFVGRQSEMEQLQRAFAQAKAGHGQIVGVMGEPGVGKSRLFHEFKLLSQRGCLVLETFSVSHGKAYAYLPLIELLHNYFQITLQDDERRRREKVGGKVLMLDRSLEDTLPYLFGLLGIAESTSPLPQMDPQIRKRRTFEAIKRLLIRESLNQPFLLIFEDLHWLDTETQAFLSLLSESVATAKILLLVNYRPEYRHDWGNKTYYTQLRLDSLGQADAQEMLAALLGQTVETLHATSLQKFILEKTEGNPFFMEELVQALVEQGLLIRDGGRAGLNLAPTLNLADLRLPTTVQGVLAARIDRLPLQEKELLQILSVIGKEFALSLLKQVVDQPEDELHRLLSHLQTAEFIYEQPAFPEIEYVFKHALTQEVAYNSLLLERRKPLHERAAQAIEGLFHSRLEDHYNDLAHHYSRSGNTQKAVEYLQLAGQQAVQRSAYAEAISHLTTALDLLKTLPDTPERIRQELDLQATLGPALIATRGYAAPEVERTYRRAQELCLQVGETPQLANVLWALWAFHFTSGKLQGALEIAEQYRALAERTQQPALLLETCQLMGTTLLYLGDLSSARPHLERGIAMYDPQQHHALIFEHGGADTGVAIQSQLALLLWQLGYSSRARAEIHDALTLAHKLSHPFSLALILSMTAELHQRCGEAQAARERAEAVITLCSEQGFPFWLAWGTILRGWALAEQSQGEEVIAQMRQGLAAWRATGAELQRPYYLARLAEAYGKVGQAEEGLTMLAEALAMVDKNGERRDEAELYRLQGQLTLQKFQVSGFKFQVQNSPESGVRGPESEAEECFLQAIEIARRQQAKSLELRAVTSLSRLWQQQSKGDEARKMLAEIYNWFTEGFDTADLQEAKALLEELSHRTIGSLDH